MTVVPNGVEVPPETTPGGGAVGTLSVLEPVKDLDTFLDAAALLGDVPFVVYGTGLRGGAAARRAGELGLADRVAFPGHVPAGGARGAADARHQPR